MYNEHRKRFVARISGLKGGLEREIGNEEAFRTDPAPPLRWFFFLAKQTLSVVARA